MPQSLFRSVDININSLNPYNSRRQVSLILYMRDN